MKIFISCFFSFYLTIGFSQNELQDSLISTNDTISFYSTFKKEIREIEFKPAKWNLNKNNKQLVDSVVALYRFYKKCDCIIDFPKEHKIDSTLINKRINSVIQYLNVKLDTSKIRLDIFYPRERKEKYQPIFGNTISKKTHKRYQNILLLELDCSNTLYAKNDSTPFTGYYIFPGGNRIESMTHYINGIKNGPFYRWNSNKLKVTGNYSIGLINGRWIVYSKNGQIQSIKQFSAGKELKDTSN